MATGFGLRLVGRLGGGRPNVQTYYVPSTDSTALLVGDVVSLASTGALDPNNEVPVVTRATAGHSLLGAVVGFRPDASAPYSNSRAASTNRYIQVCDDPEAIYEVQEDGVGNAVTAVEIGERQNADIIVAAGANGLSGTMLDSSTAAATSAGLKILGAKRDKVSAATVDATPAVLLVKIFEHASVRVDSVNSDGSITE